MGIHWLKTSIVEFPQILKKENERQNILIGHLMEKERDRPRETEPDFVLKGT